MDVSYSQRILVSPASKQDVPLILRFIQTLAEYESLSDEVIATEDSLCEALFGSRSVAECVIAFFDGEPAGFALFFPTFSTFLGRTGIYLEDLFVIQAHRGKGIGKALIAYVAQLAHQRGCARIDWCVLNWNQPAQEFYQKLGAKRIEEWIPFRLSGDALERLGTTGYPRLTNRSEPAR